MKNRSIHPLALSFFILIALALPLASGAVGVKKINLKTNVIGTGSGTIIIQPGKKECGKSCTNAFNFGTKVTLTAKPAAGSVFKGWGGSCYGTKACVLTLKTNRTVTARFVEKVKVTVNSASCVLTGKDKDFNGNANQGLANVQLSAAGTASGAVGTYLTLPYWWPYTGVGAQVNCGTWSKTGASATAFCIRRTGQPITTNWSVSSPITNTYYNFYKQKKYSASAYDHDMDNDSSSKTAACVWGQ